MNIENLSLWQHQVHFSSDYQKLLNYAISLGYDLTLGELHRPTYVQKYLVSVGLSWTKNSQHSLKLAGDINLFKNGKYLISTYSHKNLGIYWEGLSPFNVWGGRFKDGNHYERRHDTHREFLRNGKYKNGI